MFSKACLSCNDHSTRAGANPAIRMVVCVSQSSKAEAQVRETNNIEQDRKSNKQPTKYQMHEANQECTKHII